MSAFDIIQAAERVANRRKWRSLVSRLNSISSAPHYCEPGYNTDKPVILFGNWNHIHWPKTDYDWQREGRERRPDVYDTPEHQAEDTFWLRVVKALERCAELEWEDEWTTCSNCGGAIRTQADCYHWQRSYVELDGDILCHECAQKCADEIVEDFVGSDTRCLTKDLGIDLSEHGFDRLDQDFENGLYGGQDNHPKQIAAALRKRGVDRFIFTLDSVGQFDMDFSVWIDRAQMEKIPCGIPEGETKCALDPAEGLKRALQSASLQHPDGDGITVTKIDVSTGTATTRKVSNEKFIKGIKD